VAAAGAVVRGGRAALQVEDAVAVAAGGRVGQRERAAAVGRHAVANAGGAVAYRQAGDADRRPVPDLEDVVVTAGVPPDRQEVSSRPLNADVVGQVRQLPGQVYGAGDARAELDAIPVGGIGDAVAQAAVQARTHQVIGQMIHGEGRKEVPVLQHLDQRTVRSD